MAAKHAQELNEVWYKSSANVQVVPVSLTCLSGFCPVEGGSETCWRLECSSGETGG